MHMKRVNFLLLVTLLLPSISLATECSIANIDTSYIVTKERISLRADVLINNASRKPVPDAEITTIWLEDSKTKTKAKCITGADGKCKVVYNIRTNKGRKIKDLPQIGVRVTEVICPDLRYIYEPNSGFAWVITN